MPDRVKLPDRRVALADLAHLESWVRAHAHTTCIPACENTAADARALRTAAAILDEARSVARLRKLGWQVAQRAAPGRGARRNRAGAGKGGKRLKRRPAGG